jgi:hypothetical protein
MQADPKGACWSAIRIASVWAAALTFFMMPNVGQTLLRYKTQALLGGSVGRTYAGAVAALGAASSSNRLSEASQLLETHKSLQHIGVYIRPVLMAAILFTVLELFFRARRLRANSRFAGPRHLTPPPNAEFLFYLFMTPQNCDALVGDLEERYKLIHKKFGRRRANFWYWTQTVTSVGPIVWAWGKKVVMKPAVAFAGWAVAKGLVGHDSWLAALVELVKKVRS